MPTEKSKNAGPAIIRARAFENAAKLAPIIAEIRASGVISANDITAELNRRRIPALRGGTWHDMQVRRLLARLDESTT